jgi:hypothetical protein
VEEENGMKSFRNTAVFAAVILALVAFTFYDLRRGEKQAEQEEKGKLVLDVKAEEIGRFEILTRIGSTVLEKTEGQWFLRQPIADSADQTEVQNLLSSFESETTIATVDEGESVDFARFGLQDPLTRLKLTLTDGRTREVRIGSVKAFDANLYARIDDEKRVVMVSQSWDLHLSKRIDQLRDKRLFRQTEARAQEEIRRIRVRQVAAGLPSEIELEAKDDKWRLVKGGETAFPVAENRVKAFVDQVKALRGLDFADEDKATPGVLAKRGLIRPAMQIELFGDSDSGRPVFALGFSAPLKPANGKGSGNGGNAFVVSSHLKPVLEIYKAAVDSVQRRADDFFDKKLPFRFQAGVETKLEIETPELKARLIKQGEKWVLESFGGEPPAAVHEVDQQKVNGFLGKLVHMEAIRILEPLKKGQAGRLVPNSRIALLKEDGAQVFELVWGQEIVEKAEGSRPEARYHLGKTSEAGHLLGLPAFGIRGLEIASLVKNSAQAQEKKSEMNASEIKMEDIVDVDGEDSGHGEHGHEGHRGH